MNKDDIRNTKDLTSHMLQNLTLSYSYSELAEMYGVSRQRVHQIEDRFVEQGLMSDEFIKSNIVATLNSFDIATNMVYNIDIISIHFDLDRILISVDGDLRWTRVQELKKGLFFQWSFTREGKLRRRNAYLKDFVIVDTDRWEYIIINIITK